MTDAPCAKHSIERLEVSALVPEHLHERRYALWMQKARDEKLGLVDANGTPFAGVIDAKDLIDGSIGCHLRNQVAGPFESTSNSTESNGLSSI